MVIIVMGVSGSGKTTIARLLAERLAWDFFDGDDFHPPENITRMQNGIPLTDEDRKTWLAALRGKIDEIIKKDASAVLACSALKIRYRSQLRVSNQVRFVYLKGSYEQILARMQKRGSHFMKPEMLASQFAALEEPTDALTVNIALEPGEIVEQLLAMIDKMSD